MSALVDQQVNTGASESGKNNQVNGNSMFEVTVSPAGLALKMLNEVANLLEKNNALEAKETILFVDGDALAATLQSHATKEAGKKYEEAMLASGGAQILGAVGSTALGLGAFQNRAKVGKANDEIAALEKEKAPIMNLNEMESKSSGFTGGNKTLSPKGAERLQELKEGKYETKHTDSETQEALGSLKAKGNEEDYKSYKKKIKSEQDRISKDINTKTSEIQTAYQTWSVWSGLVRESTSGASNAVGGVANGMKAEEEARAQLAGTTASMANQGIGEHSTARREAGAAEMRVYNDTYLAIVASGNSRV